MQVCSLDHFHPSPPLLPLTTAFLLSVSTNLAFSRSTYKWYHTVFVFLWFFLSAWCPQGPLCCRWQDFLLSRGWILFHSIHTSSLSIYLSIDTHQLHHFPTRGPWASYLPALHLRCFNCKIKKDTCLGELCTWSCSIRGANHPRMEIYAEHLQHGKHTWNVSS